MIDAPHGGFILTNTNVWEPVNPVYWTKISESEWIDSDAWLVTQKEGKLVFVRTSDESIWDLAPGTEDDVQKIRRLEESDSDIGTVSDDDDDFTLDLTSDFAVKSFTLRGKDDADLCQDRQSIPIEAISDNSEASCQLTALYDGMYGRRCSEFIAEKLGPAILAAYRSVSLQEKGTHSNLQVYDTANPKFEDAVRKLDAPELARIVWAIKKGVVQADQNWINTATKPNYPDGATFAALLLYGPDPNGNLNLISFNTGDCESILVSDETDPLVLTHRHTLSDPEEKRRVADGEVSSSKLVRSHPSATRGLGFLDAKIDRAKKPFKNPRLSCLPHISVHTVDFGKDNFVLIGSASLWDKVTYKDAVDHVRAQMRTEFEEFLPAAQTQYQELDSRPPPEEWFATETVRWLKQNSFEKTLSSLCTLAREKGCEEEDVSVILCLFSWRPLEAFVGGEEAPPSSKKRRVH